LAKSLINEFSIPNIKYLFLQVCNLEPWD